MEITKRINELMVNIGETHHAQLDGLITVSEYLNKILFEVLSFHDQYVTYVDNGGHCYLAMTSNLHESLQFSEREDMAALRRARTWADENNLDSVYVMRISKGGLQDMAVISKGSIII